jgi:hypothetical protein
MNVSRNSVALVIKIKLQAIFVTWLHSNLAGYQTNLYVFFDTEFAQDLEKRDRSFEHVPNLIYAQQMSWNCEKIEDMNI